MILIVSPPAPAQTIAIEQQPPHHWAVSHEYLQTQHHAQFLALHLLHATYDIFRYEPASPPLAFEIGGSIVRAALNHSVTHPFSPQASTHYCAGPLNGLTAAFPFYPIPWLDQGLESIELLLHTRGP